MRLLQRSGGRGRCLCRATRQAPSTGSSILSRRAVLTAPVAAVLLETACRPAAAFEAPRPGLSRHSDRLDGYLFQYPESWIKVTSSGNDIFYRNPRIVDENLFVNFSSPSSSSYSAVSDLGSPENVGKRLQAQFLKEFMSTRLGVRREIQPLFAEERTGPDGQLYYDVGTRIQSYASRQQLAVTGEERAEATVQEFDRVLLTTLGVANSRLYEFRLQTSYPRYEKDSAQYRELMESFRCQEV